MKIKRKQSKGRAEANLNDRSGGNCRCLFMVVWALIGFIFMKLNSTSQKLTRPARILILRMRLNRKQATMWRRNFFVDIASNWHTDYYDDMPPESRLVSFFASVRCRDNTLSHDEQSELEEQLEKHIYDRYDKYY